MLHALCFLLLLSFPEQANLLAVYIQIFFFLRYNVFLVVTFQAGSVEGQVVEMGLTTTSLLNAEKFPVLVPNSLFSSQVSLSISHYSSSYCTSLCSGFQYFTLRSVHTKLMDGIKNDPKV